MLRNLLSTCTPLRIEQGKISLMGCNSAGQIVYGVTCRVGYCRKYETEVGKFAQKFGYFRSFPKYYYRCRNDRIGGVDTWMANMSDFLTKVVSNCTIVTSADVSTHV